MGLRGPAPKPSVIEIADGMPGKRRLNMREPQPRVGEPPVPKHLSAPARRHWRRLVDLLIGTRVLTLADGDALGMIAQHMADRDELQRNIRKTGWLIKASQGWIKTNPLVPTEMKITREIMVGLREFGLTPAARTRVQTVAGPIWTTEDRMFG
jgi:P27 family predicted phage terminase small subunit